MQKKFWDASKNGNINEVRSCLASNVVNVNAGDPSDVSDIFYLFVFSISVYLYWHCF